MLRTASTDSAIILLNDIAANRGDCIITLETFAKSMIKLGYRKQVAETALKEVINNHLFDGFVIPFTDSSDTQLLIIAKNLPFKFFD